MANDNSRNHRKTRAALWTLQGLLAALFLFAGGMKLAMPAEMLTAQSPFSAAFLRFIGVAEALGALGLVLPSALRIAPGLTPIAASGLVIIMIGATVTTIPLSPAGAVVPAAIGALAAFVAHGRWRIARIAPRSAVAYAHALRRTTA